MTEKIEWYKEVLELEPNSKVFFPLARLLAEEGRAEEAIAVLEQGLIRHEEFLEARLFLIELLHASGLLEACEKQVGKLTKMFTTYAGFWQAWAACMSASGEAPDTAAVLRFLALNFSRGPVSLGEVLNQGVTAFAAQSGVAARQAAEAQPEPCAVAPAQPLAAAPAEQPVAFAQPVEAEPEAMQAEAMQTEDMHAEAMQPGAVAQDAEVAEAAAPDVFSFDPATAMADEESFALGQPEEAASAPVQEAVFTQPVEAPAAAISLADADEGEERFSLRTRSMAEVLAEQGDIKGALDIYHELAAAAVHPEESADLRQRIATLSARLGNAQPAEPVRQTTDAPQASGKDKLISMLEALAERVEARAHS